MTTQKIPEILLTAILEGDASLIEDLLSTSTYQGETLLSTCLAHIFRELPATPENLELASAFINHGAKPLYLLQCNFMMYGPSDQQTWETTEIPLYTAARAGKIEFVELCLRFLQEQPDVSSESYLEGALSHASVCEDRMNGAKIIDLLFTQEVKPDNKPTRDYNPLYGAAEKGNIPVVGALIHHGFNADYFDSFSCRHKTTALEAAASQDHSGVVETLLRARANPAIQFEIRRKENFSSYVAGHYTALDSAPENSESRKLILTAIRERAASARAQIVSAPAPAAA